MASDAEIDQSLICDAQMTSDIEIPPDLMEVLCRRGRRRLRDLQQSTEAVLKLDRASHRMQVTGTAKAIADVHRLLQGYTGPSCSVPATVYAELMRTRTNPDPEVAAVAQIQKLSGCRIHIERTSMHIRLFGAQPHIEIATDILKDLNRRCVNQSVEKPGHTLDEGELLKFAQEFGITIHIQENSISFLGIEGAVTAAVARFGQNESGCSSEARLAIMKAICKLGGAENSVDEAAVVEDAQPEMLMDGAVITRLPPVEPPHLHAKQPPGDEKASRRSSSRIRPTTSQQFSECPDCGCTAKFCVHCGGGTIMKTHGAGCPTCGAVKFCMYCGMPVERLPPPAGNGAPYVTPLRAGTRGGSHQFRNASMSAMPMGAGTYLPPPAAYARPGGMDMMYLPVGEGNYVMAAPPWQGSPYPYVPW